MKHIFDPPALYPIVDVRAEEESPKALEFAAILAEAGATVVQLRAKPLTSGPLELLATRMRKALDPLGCGLIVNDRADVALSSRALGVHLGQDDLPPAAARAICGADTVIGVSTHSPDEARCADTDAASYLAFGPVFDSPTKAGVRRARGIDALATVCRESPLPVVAIGGLTLERAPLAWEAGAASVAVISELERAEDVAALVRRYLESARSYPRSS